MTATCQWCEKPALGHIDGAGGPQPICADHYIALQSVENERQRQLNDAARNNMAMLNHTLASFDEASFGL